MKIPKVVTKGFGFRCDLTVDLADLARFIILYFGDSSSTGWKITPIITPKRAVILKARGRLLVVEEEVILA